MNITTVMGGQPETRKNPMNKSLAVKVSDGNLEMLNQLSKEQKVHQGRDMAQVENTHAGP